MKKIFANILILALVMLAGCATPLMNAAKRGDLNAVEDLLNKGTDVNAEDGDTGLTVLGFCGIFWSH